jgi:nucleoside-diphosphate-sugar epimerase
VFCDDKAKGEIFNIGNPQEIRIDELAQKIRQAIGSPSKIVYCKLPEDDPRRRRPDISKAEEVLNWHPRVSLDHGLRRTIRWFELDVC